jgi:integrase
MPGHIRERSPGSFELRWHATINGKRTVRTATFRGGKRDAEAELRRVLTLADAGLTASAPKHLTVAFYLAQWLESIEERSQPRTHLTYQRTVANYLAPTLGAIRLAKLTTNDIDRAFTTWGKSGRCDGRAGGLSIAAQRYNFRVLSIALKRACRLKLIRINPCDDYRELLPSAKDATKKRPRTATLSGEQTEQLLEAARSTGTLCVPISLAVATGARRGEILAIRWRNVDFDKAQITIDEVFEQLKGVVRTKLPKEEKTRTVAIPFYCR